MASPQGDKEIFDNELMQNIRAFNYEKHNNLKFDTVTGLFEALQAINSK